MIEASLRLRAAAIAAMRAAQEQPGKWLRRVAPVAALVLSLFALFAYRAQAAAQPASAGPAVPAGGIAQLLIGLAAVLALFGALAWLLKRYSGLRGTGSGPIRVLGGAAVGQRERVVLVEVGDTWLLLGVAPGQVRALHTMPKEETAAAPELTAAADQGFASWLRRMSEKRNHD